MEQINSKKIYSIVKAAIYLSLVVVIFVLRGLFVDNLKYFIGAIMIFYGAEEILHEALFHRKEFLHQSKNYLGFVELILGVSILIAPLEFISVCVIWATWSIIRESYEIKEAICETNLVVLSVLSGLESLVVIVFSILLLFHADEHAVIVHMYLLLVEIAFAGLIPFFDELITKKED